MSVLDELAAETTREGYIQLCMRKTGLTYEQVIAEWAKIDQFNAVNDGVKPVEVPHIVIKRRRMRSAGVPELHTKNVSDREPIDCEALQLVRRMFEKQEFKILVLSSSPGTRKTGSACWILSQISGRFIKANDLLGLSINKRNDYESLKKEMMVVLDDLGTEIPDDKGYFYNVINELLDTWYGSKAWVIITTNLELAQFKERYGERIVDRIREVGKFVTIAGESVRKRA